MKTKYHIKTLLAGALFMGFTACAEEDIPQTANGLAGQLHFGSVTVGETHLASRAIVEGNSTAPNSFPCNQVITGFSQDDKLALKYKFGQSEVKNALAIYNGTKWDFDANTNIKPTGENEKWGDLNVEISFLPVDNVEFVTSIDVASFNDNNSPIKRAYYDKLEASTTIVPNAAGSITVITDLKSSELGKLTVNFRHAHALLRLPFTDEKIKINNIHEGTLISGKEKLAALWAELKNSAEEVIYVPLTKVTIGSNEYLQAIAPVDYRLTGFKAVLKKSESENITISIPLESEITLACNNQYNLSLNITNQVSVELGESDKPGWGQDIVLQQSAINKVLKFNTQEQFEVSDPNGLHELNKWMTGNGGDDVKFIEGYGSIDQTKSKLSYDITIKEDIDFTNVAPTYDLDGDLTQLSNWIPLGTAEEPYTGTITVEPGAEITGLKIHVNESHKGFVGYLGKEGQVIGLKLKGEFSSSASNFGAVVGNNDGGIVQDCETLNGTNVTGYTSGSYIGGVVGWNNTGLVTNCVNNAKVDAPNHNMVGGVLGENHRLDNCVITNCTNKGAVTGKIHVGGVVGINHRVVNNCHNTGSVTGDTHVGGVVGMNNDYSPIPDPNNKAGWPIYLINGTNTGTVEGKLCVGGVVGSNGSRGTSGGYIVASLNSGSIKLITETVSPAAAEVLYSAVGGVVGVNYHHSYEVEELTPEQLARHGNRTSQIIACYNIGAITATGTGVKVGGVVGVNEAGSKVWASYWNTSGVVNGCGDEQNTDSNYPGKEYTNGFDNSKMNEAITKYLVETAEGGYGIVEGPSYGDWSKFTTTVLRYDSTGNLVNSSTSGSND